MSGIAIGTKLDGKYVVRRLLGKGGFGQVYLADDAVLPNRPVAIKIMGRPGPQAKELLLWEMQHLSRLSHPGVVTFYHHFEQGDHLCLVMEYCPRGSLDDLLREQHEVEVKQAFDWALRLCETLTAVHAAEIAHHDIKPGNILFTTDGGIKLGDFGVANQRSGTRIFMAPEFLAGGRVSRTDPRVDVYALGLTILELLTGRHPFEDVPEDQQIHFQWKHAFVPGHLPRWVQEVLLKATHPAPESRFQTTEQFAEAIRAKHVSFAPDGARIRASRYAEHAERELTKRRWRRALVNAEQALSLCPDSIPALLAAGRCHLVMRRPEHARTYFDRALALNPRAPIQKELGWIHLEQGRVPAAISLLTDHLQRSASDFEAYNLLLKCYFLTDRWEAGLNLASELLRHRPPSRCFSNNAILFMILVANGVPKDIPASLAKDCHAPFIDYNRRVAAEAPGAWQPNGAPALSAKLLFEEYRFGLHRTHLAGSAVVLHVPGVGRVECERSIISIGSLGTNDFVLDGGRVSRRHCLILNIADEVWLHDLGSTCGTTVDGHPVDGSVFLDGVHDVDVGGERLRIAARRELLI